MEVRQAVAGIRRTHLFDEFDHLGAYLIKNRFDQDIVDQLKGGKVSMLIWDRMSDIIDKCFESENWEREPFPTQGFPEEVLKLLAALDSTRSPGWLSAESHIRDLGEEGRNNLGKMLLSHRQSLKQRTARYFTIFGDVQPLFVWLQRDDQEADCAKVNDKASAAALALNASDIVAVVAAVGSDGSYQRAERLAVPIPSALTDENAHIYADAKLMAQPSRMVEMNSQKKTVSPMNKKKVGRNDPCPCESGVKYKKCHGR